MTTGIKHKKVVSSRDKGLAFDWNDIHEIDGNFDAELHQALNFVLENRTDYPAGPVEGQIIYRTDLNLLYTYNGATWESCVMAESDQTISGNKTFSGDQTFTGDVTIDIRTGDVFELKDDFMTWIKYDYADGTMSIGKEIGEDWTEIDFYGTIGFNRTPTIINPAPVLDGAIVHKKYVDDKVAIVKGTHYWSYPGSGFLTFEPAVDNIFNDADNGVFGVIVDSNVGASAPVVLPHGAVVTQACVYGDTTWNWYLFRDTHKSSGAPGTLASGTRDSCDTSINFATIDNNTYKYWFEVFPLDTDEHIDGAEIRYTL